MIPSAADSTASLSQILITIDNSEDLSLPSTTACAGIENFNGTNPCDAYNDPGSSLTYDQSGLIGTSQIGAIEIFSEVSVIAATGSAFADPIVQIDPTFLAANPGYSLEFSSGLISAAPEPGSVGLTLIGLGMLALMRKRLFPEFR
jgi:hypothetical protein